MTANISPETRAAWQVPAFDVPLWKGRRHSYCVVIPVINEGDRIKSLLRRMQAAHIAEMSDIIIVDGGSTDESLVLDMLDSLDVRGVLIKTGGGKLSAQLRCAYAYALEQGYSGIITIDGNNKDDPTAIHKFKVTLEQGYDFVQASRYIIGGVADNTPKIRDIAIRFIHAPVLSLFSGFRWTDTTQGFRGYSRKLLLAPEIAPFRDVFNGYELLAYLSYRAPRLGYRCIELPTVRRYPADGAVPTKISAFKGNWSVMRVLVNACLGAYDPRPAQILGQGPQ